MPMMQIGPVGMHVRDRFVAVAVRVRARREHVVVMVVMAVIVAMRVVVLDRFV
jgi:hypothetical protein